MSRAIDLLDFDVGGMVGLVEAIRGEAVSSTSIEDFAQHVTELLHGTFVAGGDPQTTLVRFYGTATFGALPAEDRAYVASRSPVPLTADTTCLTLLGTAGTQPEWCDRRSSSGHRVLPLAAPEQVASMPMISALLQQLGIDVAALTAGEPDVMLKSGDGSCRVFYVADAAGSPLIPAQDFVRDHQVASAVGFGGGVPTGEVFAVVMFNSVAVPLPSAELFETVALSVRLAMLDMLDLPLLSSSITGRPMLGERQLLEARSELSQALLSAHEAIAAAQADRLRSALTRATYDAARATALAGVAARLSRVSSVSEVTEVLVQDGLRALGADGLSVALVDQGADYVDVTVSSGFGPEVARNYARLPLDDALPTTYTARTGETVVVGDILGAPHDFPQLGDVARDVGIASVVSLPLAVGDRLIGAVTCTWSQPQVFGGDDIGHMRAVAAQAAQVIERWRLLDREREHNETLQRSLLTAPPRDTGCDIAVRYVPAAELAQIGGDWHDSFHQRDDSVILVIGDVVGHDTAAAAAMAQVRGLLRGIAWCSGAGPADVLQALDEAMEQLEVDTTASCLVARVARTPDGGWQLTWSSAGHPPAMLLTADRGARVLDFSAPDIILGVDPNASRHESTVPLPAGSTVVLYTDGLVERRGQDFDEGVEHLLRAVTTSAELPLEQLCDALLESMPDGADDDVALLALRIRGDA